MTNYPPGTRVIRIRPPKGGVYGLIDYPTYTPGHKGTIVGPDRTTEEEEVWGVEDWDFLVDLDDGRQASWNVNLMKKLEEEDGNSTGP